MKQVSLFDSESVVNAKPRAPKAAHIDRWRLMCYYCGWEGSWQELKLLENKSLACPNCSRPGNLYTPVGVKAKDTWGDPTNPGRKSGRKPIKRWAVSLFRF